MTALNKKGNEYMLLAGRDLYERIPKAVWAAIAISALTCGGDAWEEARERVLAEWQALAANGIVPQQPPCAATTTTLPRSHN